MILNLQSNDNTIRIDLIELYQSAATVLQNNSENVDIVASIRKSQGWIKNGGSIDVQNNNENSFYVLPFGSNDHAFNGVIKMENNKYKVSFVGNASNVTVVAFENKKELDTFITKSQDWPQKSFIDVKKDFDQLTNHKSYTVNISPKEQVLGNCIFINALKAMKVAMVGPTEIRQEQQKTVKLKWFKDGKDISNHIFKRLLVKEYSKETDVQDKRKIDDLVAVYDQKKLISKAIQAVQKGLEGSKQELNEIVLEEPKKITFNSIIKILSDTNVREAFSKEHIADFKEIYEAKKTMHSQLQKHLKLKEYQKKEASVKLLEKNPFALKGSQIESEFKDLLYDLARKQLLIAMKEKKPNLSRANFLLDKALKYCTSEQDRNNLTSIKKDVENKIELSKNNSVFAFGHWRRQDRL